MKHTTNKRTDRAAKGSKSRSSKSYADKRSTENSTGAISSNVSGNDPKWYKVNPALVSGAAKIQFSNVTGLPTQLRNGQDDWTDRYVTPGILHVPMIPVAGVSYDGNSALNINARLIYGWVRHSNSGSRNYEATDLMTYIIAMAHIYGYYAELVRLYGLLRAYSQTNRYVGKAMVMALGYSYDDLMRHIPDLRYYINAFAVKANTFAVPSSMTYFDRITWVPLQILKDTEDNRSQFILPQYCRYYKWDGTASTGSSLQPVVPPSASGSFAATFDEIVAFGDGLINNLLTNEDIGIMSGDIIKAFPSGLRTLNAVPEDFVIAPRYDAYALSMIHNATCYDFVPAGLAVSQIGTNLLCRPTFDSRATVGGTYDLDYQFLDMEVDDPGEDDVIEGTRMKSSVTINENLGYSITDCGTEIVIAPNMITYNNEGALVRYYIYTPMYSAREWKKIEPIDMIGSTPILNRYMQWEKYRQFEHAPLLYARFAINPDNEDAEDDYKHSVILPAGALHNYTTLTKENISRLNRACLTSLLAVPQASDKV